MSEEEMLALAQKVKDGTATEEEAILFMKEYADLVSSLNEELKKED